MNKKEKEEMKEIAEMMNNYKETLIKNGIEVDLAKSMTRDFHKTLVKNIMARQQMKDFEKGFQSALQDNIYGEFGMDLSDLDA